VKRSPLDQLLLEAGSALANRGSPVFRNAAARAAGALFIPGPPDCSAGKAGAARALRETIKALASVETPQAREKVAEAVRLMIAAVNSEPSAARPVIKGEPRKYWVEQ